MSKIKDMLEEKDMAEEGDILKDIKLMALECGQGLAAAESLSERKGELLALYNLDKLTDSLKLRRQIPKKWLPRGFNGMTVEYKRKLLWDLGVNTKKYFWWEDIVCAVFQTKKEVLEVCIGEERTDKAWVAATNTEGVKLSSFEAQLAHRKDPSLTRELSKISNGRSVS